MSATQKPIQTIDVLVGESRDSHAELVEASLREIGIVKNLYRGRNGMETLALVRDRWTLNKHSMVAPSLIFLDCALPELGGVAVLKSLDSTHDRHSAPVIMMTEAHNIHEAERCECLGCDAYVTKWSVFLGMPSFVRRVRHLADRVVPTTLHCHASSCVYRHSATTLDRRASLDANQIYRCGHQRTGGR